MHDRTAILVGLGVVAGLAGLAWYAGRQVKGAVAAGALDPTSANNLAHQLAATITEAFSGVKGDTPGVAVHRWVYPEYEAYDPTKPGTIEEQARARRGADLPASESWGAVTPFSFGA